jgi:hypothetical protein
MTENTKKKENWTKPEGYKTGIKVYNSLSKTKVTYFSLNFKGRIDYSRTSTLQMVHLWTNCVRLESHGTCENLPRI